MAKHRLPGLTLISLVAYAATSALAQTPESPLRVGDRFVYQVGPVTDTQEIIEIRDREIVVRSSGFGDITQSRSIIGGWSWSGGSLGQKQSEAVDPSAQSLVPLEVGKTVNTFGQMTFIRNQPDYFRKKCTVVSKGPATVPAGTFDVYLIACELVYLGGRILNRTYYYAPELDYYASFSLTAKFDLIEYKKAVP